MAKLSDGVCAYGSATRLSREQVKEQLRGRKASSRLTQRRTQPIAAWRPTLQNAICAAARSVDEALALWESKLRFIASLVCEELPDSTASSEFESAIGRHEFPLCSYLPQDQHPCQS